MSCLVSNHSLTNHLYRERKTNHFSAHLVNKTMILKICNISHRENMQNHRESHTHQQINGKQADYNVSRYPLSGNHSENLSLRGGRVSITSP